MSKWVVALIFLANSYFLHAKPAWCAHAKLSVEKRICRNPQLLRLENRLLDLYRKNLRRSTSLEKRILRQEQRNWIRVRNRECAHRDDSCLKYYYVDRISDLGGKISSNNTTRYPKALIKRLKNLDYTNEGRHFRLKNGHFRVGSLSAGTFDSYEYGGILAGGNLDSDKAKEYIVVLDENSGGSGMFSALCVVKDNGKTAHSLWCDDMQILGDRVKILESYIKNKRLYLTIKTHGPHDASCCPTKIVTKVYKLRGKRLVKVR